MLPLYFLIRSGTVNPPLILFISIRLVLEGVAGWSEVHFLFRRVYEGMDIIIFVVKKRPPVGGGPACWGGGLRREKAEHVIALLEPAATYSSVS